MSANDVGHALGTLFAAWWLFGLISFLALSYFVPIMLFIATRNVRKIRRELERLNEILESRLSSGPADIARR